MYLAFIPSPNFDFVENGRMFQPYKQKGKVECWPLALSSKRHVVLQTTAKKCIKARCNTIKSFDVHKYISVAAYPGIKLVPIMDFNLYPTRRA